jgi:hypothetical protein
MGSQRRDVEKELYRQKIAQPVFQDGLRFLRLDRRNELQIDH